MYTCNLFDSSSHVWTCENMSQHVLLTFLYIAQMSWYLIGKITKRFGFSRSNGSSWGSNFIVGTFLMAVKPSSLDRSIFGLNILVGDAPSTGAVAVVLRGLCFNERKIQINLIRLFLFVAINKFVFFDCFLFVSKISTEKENKGLCCSTNWSYDRSILCSCKIK